MVFLLLALLVVGGGDAYPQDSLLLSCSRSERWKGTSVLAAVAGIVACFPTDEAGLVPGWLFGVPSLASAGVVLQLDFHLLAAAASPVQPAYRTTYSPTAVEASSPSLNSMKAKQY